MKKIFTAIFLLESFLMTFVIFSVPVKGQSKESYTAPGFISFDDGGESDLPVARLLYHEGIPATFFLTHSSPMKYFAAELICQGHEMGGHTLSHRHMGIMTVEELFHELVLNRISLESLTEEETVSFSYPFLERGREYSEDCLRKAGYLVARAGFFYPSRFEPDPLALPAVYIDEKTSLSSISRTVEIFLEKKLPVSFWSHSGVFSSRSSREKLAAFLKTLGEKYNIKWMTYRNFISNRPEKYKDITFIRAWLSELTETTIAGLKTDTDGIVLRASGYPELTYDSVEFRLLSFPDPFSGGTLEIEIFEKWSDSFETVFRASPRWKIEPVKSRTKNNRKAVLEARFSPSGKYSDEPFNGNNTIVIELDGEFEGYRWREYYVLTRKIDFSTPPLSEKRSCYIAPNSIRLALSPNSPYMPLITGEFSPLPEEAGNHPSFLGYIPRAPADCKTINCLKKCGWLAHIVSCRSKTSGIQLEANTPFLIIREEDREPAEYAPGEILLPLKKNKEETFIILSDHSRVLLDLSKPSGLWIKDENALIEWFTPAPEKKKHLIEKYNALCAGCYSGQK